MKLKKEWTVVLLPISGILLWIAQSSENIAEMVFTRGIYRKISSFISEITGKTSFSIMEASVIMLPFLILAIGIFYIVQYRKKVRSGREIAVGILCNILIVFSVVFFLYTVLCGINYYRYSFAKISGLTIKKVEKQELKELSLYLAKEARAVRKRLVEDNPKIDDNMSPLSYGEMAEEAIKAMKGLGKKYPVLGQNYSRPKAVIHSDIMSKLGITGIFWPFTLEANVNVHVEQFTIPAVMCHEMAHVSGFMREDEANFIAYLACKYSESLEFQYSGYMMALEYSSRRLYKVDRDAYIEVQKTYSGEMQEDIRADSSYWGKYQGTSVREASNFLNDSYLKANSQGDGVMSYGRMVDLLLAEYKESNENSR